MKSHYIRITCACVLAFFASSSHAASIPGQGTWTTTLQPRDLDGNPSTVEAWYDTTLGITWLANANLAATNTFSVSGINANGSMTWDTANAWIGAMNTDNYLGYNGWRLPIMTDTGTPGCDYANSGTDCGYNVQTTSGSPPYPAATVYSEMASMFYDTLGNKAYLDASGAVQTGWGFTNAGPFDNVQSAQNDYYWTGLEYAPNTSDAWLFTFHDGSQNNYPKDGNPYPIYGWAVHTGDIGSAVPLPAAVWLFGGGLLGLISVGRRRS